MTERPKLITANQFHAALVAAGVFRGPESELIRRIVVDAEVGNAVLIYVERYGDERMLQVAQTLEGVEVSGVPAERTQ